MPERNGIVTAARCNRPLLFIAVGVPERSIRLAGELRGAFGDDHARQLARGPDMAGGSQTGGSSNEPPFTVIVSVAPIPSCHTREPQAGQNAQYRVPPLSVARDQTFTSPRMIRKSERLMMTEMPNADADCFWAFAAVTHYSDTGSQRIS
jgi:hypothetical protein